MGATSKTEENQKETLTDDISAEKVRALEEAVDNAKLEALKARSRAKQQESKQENNMAAKIVGKKDRSLELGVVGVGQCGSRIAQAFHKLGYDVIVANTAVQDLKHIDVPDSNKLLFSNHSSIGGAARELSIGELAAKTHSGEVMQMVNEKLADAQVLVLATSLGGGSGAGSVETMVELLNSTGKPLIVITVLPMDSEDAKIKSNSLETLSKLTKMAQDKTIANLIVADNAKIETVYHDVGQMDFYDVANKAIVEVLDVFNTHSSMPSPMKPLDSAEMTKLLIDGGGLTIYGQLTVSNYEQDTAVAEAIVNDLNNNLLASGFDLTQSKYVGFMVVANKDVWSKIPSSSINYAVSMVSDLCSNPQIYKGLYVVDMPENVVKVYSYFTGLGLPSSRVDQLKKDAIELSAKVKAKDDVRSTTLKLDTGVNETVSQAQKIKEKIAAKSSAFGKLMSGVNDRRK